VLLDAAVALAILVVCAVLVAQLAYSTAQQRNRLRARQVATEQAANVLEAIRLEPWQRLTPQFAATWQLPAAVARALNEGRLVVHIENESALVKRVSVAVHWNDDAGNALVPVRLVTWIATREVGGKP
jgi:hypothetical protein